MRFMLIDQILEQSDERIVAVKTVAMSEEYLADHFPQFPVLPGVMMLEALVQAARALLSGRDDTADGPWVLAEVRNVRYGNMVRPGQTLRLTVDWMKAEAGSHSFKGLGEVEGDTALQARFDLKPLEPTPA